MKHILDPVPDLLAQRPDLPPEAEVVVSKALAKERNDRFESASDFSSALSTLTKESQVSEDFRKQLATIQADITPEMAAASAAGKPDTPVDHAPSDLAEDVLADMGVRDATGKPPGSSVGKSGSEPSSGRNIPVWAWILVVA